MNSEMDLMFWQIVSAYLFILLLLLIVKVKGIRREKEIMISTIRMTLQLILVGYLLIYIFENPSPFVTVLIFAIMLSFATLNVFRRTKMEITRSLKKSIIIAMIFGITSSLLYFIFIVLTLAPWYDPQFFIPIAGMIIGNSMTGITLGVNHLLNGMQTQKDQVEAALILGATPKLATNKVINQAFDAALLPTINSMVGMGIVFLPGMMTGQILSGVSPLVAVNYQIAIMLGIVGSVSLSVITFLQLGYKNFFNERSQLK
ncbi:iron export ABC transporter permease subunit FetB [Bacillus sp. JCM 19034]|uniref:ABC transporter permease n=1 Tax=Bacillus sp. JCM 19034 TaxID=1481928 RepID=UPI000785B6FC|nr:iron export ABC transporter permease subunit FetB [Bacillus sp. JCM 19034]